MEQRQAFLEEVKKEPWKLQRSIYIDDREIVLAVVTKNGWALGFASDNLREDKDVVLAAATNNGCALRFAPENLRGDKDVVLAAAINNGGALFYASENLRKDKDIVLAAATSNGYCALWRASEDLRADKDVILAAVTNDGYAALEFASDNLREDKDVVLAAVANSGRALRFASENLREDKEVVLAAATNDCKALRYASWELLDCTSNDSLCFVRTVIQASSRRHFDFKYFPELKDTLSDLYLELHTGGHQGNGNLRLECCADSSPHVVAKQWLARLLETQWCLDQACRNGSASGDTQQHIREFSGLARDIQTADLLQTYPPIICAVVEKSAGVSWLEMLRFAY